MYQISNKEEFLNSNIYYPNICVIGDSDWVELKNKIVKYFNVDIHQVTVKQVAQYLIDNPNCNSTLINSIRKLYKKFKFNKISESDKIEICPSIGDNPISKYFLRGGNKRSIAYAMKIINYLAAS